MKEAHGLYLDSADKVLAGTRARLKSAQNDSTLSKEEKKRLAGLEALAARLMSHPTLKGMRISAINDLRRKFAGEYTPVNGAVAPSILINLAVAHRGGVEQTILHEAVHAVTHDALWTMEQLKNNPEMKHSFSSKQIAAAQELNKLFQEFRKKMGIETKEDLESLQKYSRESDANMKFSYGLTDVHEPRVPDDAWKLQDGGG